MVMVNKPSFIHTTAICWQDTYPPRFLIDTRVPEIRYPPQQGVLDVKPNTPLLLARWLLAMACIGGMIANASADERQAGRAYTGEVLTPDANIHDLLDGQPRELALQIEQAGLYQLDMSSDEFDSKLELTGNGLSLRGDNGEEGINSRLLAMLSPGRYTLRASGYESSARGAYRLSAVAYTLPEGLELHNGGTLTLNGPELTGVLSGRELRYEMQVERRQFVTIDMRSDVFDAYLVLNGPGVSHEVADGATRFDARILRTILEPGTYQITARSFGGGSNTGLFTLAASARDAPDSSPLTIGQRRTGELLHPRPSVEHSFSVRQAGKYVIEMTSDEIDSYLFLVRDGNLIDEDDDSGGERNARITRHLEPGEYVIEAASVDEEFGSYQIEVRRQ